MENQNTNDIVKIGENSKEFFNFYKEIYNFFEDEISKNIYIKFFECRINGNTDDLCEYSSEFVKNKWFEIQKLKNKNRAFTINYSHNDNTIGLSDIPKIDHDKTVVIYSAGRIGKELIKYYKTTNKVLVVDCYYESIVSIDGVDVISEKKAFIDHKDSNSIWIIASGNYCDLFYDNLIKAGIDNENIILNDYIVDNENQYFDFFEPRPNEIFVDCGVYDAINSIKFSDWAKDYKKIYLFEPDYDNYIKSKNNLNNVNITEFELFQVGLWNKNETLYLNNNGSSSAINSDNCDGIKIEVSMLDTILNNREVTYIKMDIEGVELKALQGAEETIKKYKPRLAICVYHKNEDIIQIPLYLKSILPEYKFALRHYTSKFEETVLYAWVE